MKTFFIIAQRFREPCKTWHVVNTKSSKRHKFSVTPYLAFFRRAKFSLTWLVVARCKYMNELKNDARK